MGCVRLTWSLTPHSPAARLTHRYRRPVGVTARGPNGTSTARIPSSPTAPGDRELAGQGLPLSRTMLSNHKLPYVGRFACDWPRLATTDPHAARCQCRALEVRRTAATCPRRRGATGPAPWGATGGTAGRRIPTRSPCSPWSPGSHPRAPSRRLFDRLLPSRGGKTPMKRRPGEILRIWASVSRARGRVWDPAVGWKARKMQYLEDSVRTGLVDRSQRGGSFGSAS
jgi:hypothetical protein